MAPLLNRRMRPGRGRWALEHGDARVVLVRIGCSYVALALLISCVTHFLGDGAIEIGGMLGCALVVPAILGLVWARQTAALLWGDARWLALATLLMGAHIALSDPGGTAPYAAGPLLFMAGCVHRERAVYLALPAMILAHLIAVRTRAEDLGRLEQWYVDAGLPAQMWLLIWVGLLILVLSGAVIGDLFRKLADAAAAERRRLSRDLHDTVAKTIQGAGLLASSLPGWVERDGSRAEQIARELARSLRTADGEARRIINGLRIDHPEDDLPNAVAVHCGRFGRTEGLEVSVSADRVSGISDEASADLFAVLVEALANVVAHAQASSVQVELVQTDAAVEIAITDDGIGGDPGEIGALEGHYGVVSMVERLRRHGGTISITTRPGAGFAVRGRIPRADPEGERIGKVRPSIAVASEDGPALRGSAAD